MNTIETEVQVGDILFTLKKEETQPLQQSRQSSN